MKNNKSLEDYLETILLLSREQEFVHRVDVARRVGVSQPAVQKAVKILENSGFAECDGLHIYLTKKGEDYAAGVYARHCIILDFLVMHGVDKPHAESDACEMEHVISDETFEVMKEYVKKHR